VADRLLDDSVWGAVLWCRDAVDSACFPTVKSEMNPKCADIPSRIPEAKGSRAFWMKLLARVPKEQLTIRWLDRDNQWLMP